MAKQVATKTLKDFVKKSNVNEVKKLIFGDKENKIEFEVKQYLPINEKREFIEIVVDQIFIEDEVRELRYADSAIGEVVTGYCIVKYYTNINSVENVYEMYDIVKSTGLLEFIESNIPESELELIKLIIDERIEEEFRIQELENTIGYKLEGTLDIVNRKIAQMLDVIKNFDSSQLNILDNQKPKDEVIIENDIIIDKEK